MDEERRKKIMELLSRKAKIAKLKVSPNYITLDNGEITLDYEDEVVCTITITTEDVLTQIAKQHGYLNNDNILEALYLIEKHKNTIDHNICDSIDDIVNKHMFDNISEIKNFIDFG